MELVMILKEMLRNNNLKHQNKTAQQSLKNHQEMQYQK